MELLPLDDNPAAWNGGFSSALSLNKVKLRIAAALVLSDYLAQNVMPKFRTFASSHRRLFPLR
jgi:hypothetical protein